MPQKATLAQVASQGATEQARIITLSELLAELIDQDVDITELPNEFDMILVAIPDTGKAKFVPAHAQKKDASKTTKATFIVAEIGGSFAGEATEYRQSNGDVEGLPLTVKLSVVAQPPNRNAVTIDEALGRKSNVTELKTGTDN